MYKLQLFVHLREINSKIEHLQCLAPLSEAVLNYFNSGPYAGHAVDSGTGKSQVLFT